MILVADSGSSKTDWILTSDNFEPLEFSTRGINPFFVSEKEISKIIGQKAEVKNFHHSIKEVHFFGEGCTNPDKREIVSNALSHVFEKAFINVDTDTLGSVYATCGNSKGFTCVIGTSSNIAFYDGSQVIPGRHDLGFILGDEGSGVYLGKKLITAYLYGKMPAGLKSIFQKQYEIDKEIIITNVYQRPLPNLYLASFAKFLSSNRGDIFVEELLEQSFNAFVESYILPYPNYQSYPIHFVGSIAFYFEDVLKKVCEKNKIRLGKILQKPVKSIAEFITRHPV